MSHIACVVVEADSMLAAGMAPRAALAAHGNFTHSSKPGVGYGSNWNCEWLVAPADRQRGVLIQFDSFSTEGQYRAPQQATVTSVNIARSASRFSYHGERYGGGAILRHIIAPH